jgi:hypothetical protein
MASVAALCVVALLAGGAYWVFASFVRPTAQTAAAADLPDDTLVYLSVDLTAAGNNSHHLTPQGLLQSSGAAAQLLRATGLDLQTDVLPWVGPGVTLGVFPDLTGAAGAAGGTGGSPADYALLLQSHDDAAAQRAIQKAVAYEGAHGATLGTSSYGGYTVYAPSGGGYGAGALATGSGLVLLASSSDAAHRVIDSAGGHGTTLSGNADFQRIVGALPADRFGTFYVNAKGLSDPLGTGASVVDVPFLDTYPVGGGALQWTGAGLRWQATFPAARAIAVPGSLGGNPAALAALVPAGAAIYVAATNVGQLDQQLQRLVTPAGQHPQDPLQGALGLAPTDPALQQPAALFLSVPAKGQAQQTGGILLRAASADAGAAVVAAMARSNQWTARAMTVDGVAATALYATAGSDATGALPLGGLVPVAEPIASPAAADQPVAVAATVDGTLAVATSATELAAVIEAARGAQPSLAQAGGFGQLVASAPTGGVALAYVDDAALRQASGTTVQMPVVPGALADPTQLATASLATLTWTAAQLQLTYDVALSQ